MSVVGAAVRVPASSQFPALCKFDAVPRGDMLYLRSRQLLARGAQLVAHLDGRSPDGAELGDDGGEVANHLRQFAFLLGELTPRVLVAGEGRVPHADRFGPRFAEPALVNPTARSEKGSFRCLNLVPGVRSQAE